MAIDKFPEDRFGFMPLLPPATGNRDTQIEVVTGGGHREVVAIREPLIKSSVWFSPCSESAIWSRTLWKNVKPIGSLGDSFKMLGPATAASRGVSHDMFWAEAFARVNLSLSMAAFDRNSEWQVGAGFMEDAVYSKVVNVNNDYAGHSKGILPMLEASIKSVVHCVPNGEVVLPKGKSEVRLFLPPVLSAVGILSRRVPKGSFAPMHRSMLPASSSDVPDWVNKHKVPVLMRVSAVHFVRKSYSDGHIWMGTKGRKFPTAVVDPIWITGEEARELSKWASFTVDVCYRSDGWQKIDLPVELCGGLPDKFIEVSGVTAPSIATIMLRALSGVTRDPEDRHTQNLNSTTLWFNMYERAACFKHAAYMEANNFPVTEYGKGSVVVAVDKEDAGEMSRLANAALSSGLMPCKWMIEHINTEAVMKESILSIEQSARLAVLARGGIDFILSSDRVSYPWPAKLPHLRKVLNASAKTLALSHEAMRLADFGVSANDWRAAIKDRLERSAKNMKSH